MQQASTLRTRILVLFCFVVLLAGSCSKSDDNNNFTGSKVYTTLDRTLVPVPIPLFGSLTIFDAAKFDQYGYGKFTYGPGIACQKRIDLMPEGYTIESSKPVSTLLHFFTVTDIHLTDKESPCQTIFFYQLAGQGGIGCYSPLILYTTHVFNAAVKTINKLDDERSFDLGLALGDMANNTQKNEVDWFIRLMDGGLVTPSSGIQPTGTLPDYQQTYTAPGLHSHIPWYAVIGNHDHFWSGSKPVTTKIRNAYIGNHILQVGDAFSSISELDSNNFSMGTVDGTSRYGTVFGCGVVDQMGSIPDISPDPDRRTLSNVSDWINEFKTSTSMPQGHGFIQDNPNNLLGGCYSFIPKSDLPLKVIVLDDTQTDDEDAVGPDSIYGHGELTADRYEWLREQLKAGQDSNQLMIIAAHVPINVVPSGNPFTWRPVPGSYETETDVLRMLQGFPNLILWVSGHRHLNNVTAIPSMTPGAPENGFWEVETKSTREFPEEFRTFDIVRNSDNTISIITTNVDIEMEDNSLAAIGRKYAIASNQIYKIDPTTLPMGSTAYNAELVKQLTPVMKEKIRNLGKPFKR